VGDINNIVVVSDLHLGCQLGLMPVQRFRLDGGGYYHRSRLQAVVARYWREFWDDFVPYATKGEPFAVVINGDLIDGRHHRATTQISQNLADQRRLAEIAIDPIHEACKGRLFVVRGTPAHSGESGEDEESIAKAIDAMPDEFGRYSRNDLWIRCGDALCHFMHHIGTSSRMAYETSAVMAELSEEFTVAARFSNQPPDIVCRSHRHKNVEISVPTDRYRGFSFVTSGWQLKTPFAWKINGKIVPPEFGGSVIRQGKRHFYIEHYVKMVSRSKTVRL